jgi:hypothetical protein
LGRRLLNRGGIQETQGDESGESRWNSARKLIGVAIADKKTFIEKKLSFVERVGGVQILESGQVAEGVGQRAVELVFIDIPKSKE